MRKQLGVLVAACFYYGGLVHLSRWLMQRSGKRLIVLNYHRASGGNLRRHMQYLKRYYRVLHLEEALEELYTPATENPRSTDLRTPLVLTFDDGYSDNYTYAFPLARSLQMPITIFVVPGYVESGQYFWWGEGQRLVRRASVHEIVVEGHKYQLQNFHDKEQLGQLIDVCVRSATSVAEREDFLTTMRQQLGVPTSVLPDEEGELPFNWEQMREMERSGWVSFGAHTMHHPVLAYLKDADEIYYEVDECRRILAQQLGHPVRTFAYPIGRFEHIGDNAVHAVQEAGYDWALTTVYGINAPLSDSHRLGRVLGDVTRNWVVMAAEVSGLWSFISPLWKRLTGKGESA